MSGEPLSFASRLFLALTTWARILTDGVYARKVSRLNGAPGALPEAAGTNAKSPPGAAQLINAVVETAGEPGGRSAAKSPSNGAPDVTAEAAGGGRAGPLRDSPHSSALVLLARLQSEGRLIDFLEDDVKPYTDAEVGAAARMVHEGCRRALREVLPIVALREEAEGTAVVLPDGFDKDTYKLTGNVTGAAPYRGTLRHRGWRISEVRLGTQTGGNAYIVAPAEVEL